MGLFLIGCAATSENNDNSSNPRKLNQADIDLIVERAKAEERARINRELMYQAKQKRVFDDILARQYAKANLADSSKKPTSLRPVQQPGLPKKIQKIIPENRLPVLYRNIDGVDYFRCAANSLTPMETQTGVNYSSDKQELSATLCKASRDKTTMLALQNALYKLGYMNSDSLTKEQLIDGIWGETTLVAVKKYQQEHGLLLGQLTIETLEHTGVFDAQVAPVDMLGVNEIQLVDNIKQGQSKSVEVKPIVAADVVAESAQVNVSDEKIDTSDVQKEVVIADNSKTIAVTKSIVTKDVLVIEKIIPTSRKPVLYKELEGVRYFRCAANALTPNEIKPGVWTYEKTKTELSATLCKMSRDVATMTALQYELYSKGYLKSDTLTQDQLIDGVWGESTLIALKEYQQQNGLLFGQLTIESLEYLGVFSADPVRVKKTNKVFTQVQKEKLKTDELKTENVKTAEPELSSSDVTTSLTEIDNSSSKKKTAQESSQETNSVIGNRQVVKTIKLVRRQGDAFKVTDVVDTKKYMLYGTVDNTKIWRCRARSEVPQILENGEVQYNGVMEFRATLCKASRSIEMIKALQFALKDKGYLKPSPPLDLVVVDGVWGINTLEAVKAYQKANGLAYGQLTLEVFEHLGIFDE